MTSSATRWKLLQHDALGVQIARAEIDVLHAGEPRFELLQVLDQLLGGAGETRSRASGSGRGSARPPPSSRPGGQRPRPCGGVMPGNEAQRREHLDVLLVVARQLADGLLATVGEVEEHADGEVLTRASGSSGTGGGTSR